jgi:CRISPR-associated protein Csy3
LKLGKIMATKSEMKTASVLAFERKLDVSDALFYSGNWVDRHANGKWDTVSVREKSVRGTISNRMKTKDQDPTKLDAKIENPNLQTVDVAALPFDADTLKVVFTIRVLGGAGQPSACNNADYRAKLDAVVAGYVNQVGFKELACRYASNLANGRFLWRNRVGAESAEVDVAHMVDGQVAKSWTFNALSPTDNLRAFPAQGEASPDLSALAAVVEAGLLGAGYTLLRVTAFVRAGAGQEVFPSQELILDKENAEDKKSKTLYDVKGVAAMHSQKLGNAIRCVDTWYPGAENLGPIPAEPYGSVTTQGKAFRQPKDKTDFYNLFDNWVVKDVAPPIEQQHFVMSILIRGGVFGDSDKE